MKPAPVHADLYEQEQAYLDDLRSRMAAPSGVVDPEGELAGLVTAYEKLLKDTRKLHRIADRQYSSLLVAQDKLTTTNEDLERVSSTDMVTGLFNRHKMQSVLQEELGRFQRTGSPACLVLIDLDRFKAINDTWGHNTGDQVLQLFSTILQGQIRTSDYAARWGGDEFLLLLPNTRAQDADRVTEGLLNAVRTARFPVTDFTVSLGVAPLEPAMALVDWLALTDRCLYWAKRTGRNRVGRPADLL